MSIEVDRKLRLVPIERKEARRPLRSGLLHRLRSGRIVVRRKEELPCRQQ